MRAALFYSPNGNPATVGTLAAGGPDFASKTFYVPTAVGNVNYIQIQGGAAGFAPIVYANGSDTNLNLSIASKNTGSIFLRTNATTATITQMAVSHTANAVNFVTVTGGATGNAVTLSSQGSDSNVTLSLSSKGSFGMGFYTNGFANQQFGISHTASAVNNVTVSGGATGSAVNISSVGIDADIDILFNAKGTGKVRFGTYTVDGTAVVAGYITVKDSGGTLRKLMVAA